MNLSSISSWFFHPVIFLVVEFLLFILLIGFTSPTATLRLATVPLIFACICKVVSVSPTLLRGPWSAWCCANIVCHLMHYIEAALIVKWSFETQNPTSAVGPQISAGKRKNRSEIAITTQTHGGTFTERFNFGSFILFSSRKIGTPYMVKGTPDFSTKDPTYIPSRRAFLIQKAVGIILALLALDFTSQAAQPSEHNAVVFSVEAVPIIRGSRENLRAENILFRSVTVLGFWLVSAIVINGVLGLSNFFNVALGIRDVRAYRPVFGPIREAYSIRQFWG